MHAVSLGHPIVGDTLYGTKEGNAKSDRLLLHAKKLCFKHVSLSPVCIVLSAVFLVVLHHVRKLGWPHIVVPSRPSSFLSNGRRLPQPAKARWLSPFYPFTCRIDNNKCVR